MFTATRLRTALAVTLALGLGATAQAQEVSSINVAGERATTVRVDIRGLDQLAVGRVVRGAAVQVCGAAIKAGELDLYDADWCERRTKAVTMGEYRRLLTQAEHPAPAHSRLVVSAR